MTEPIEVFPVCLHPRSDANSYRYRHSRNGRELAKCRLCMTAKRETFLKRKARALGVGR